MNEERKTCNMEKHRKGLCGSAGIWSHPRYPTGVFCQEHKEILESFITKEWSLVKGVNIDQENNILV